MSKAYKVSFRLSYVSIFTAKCEKKTVPACPLAKNSTDSSALSARFSNFVSGVLFFLCKDCYMYLSHLLPVFFRAFTCICQKSYMYLLS